MDIDQTTALPRAEAGLRHFMHMVYGWMSLGLLVTGACAAYMASDPQMILNLVRNKLLFYGLMGGELALVIGLSGWVASMEASTAKFCFLFYAALTGVTLSIVYLAYTRESIAMTFFLTAGLFGAMAVYGWTTKTDLTGMGNMLFMALLGLVMSSIANWWLHSPLISWLSTYVGIVIFVGLTAYDSQKIKAIYRPADDGTELETKEAIMGALALYLDFINLFLKLLSATGKRRD